MVNFTFTKLKSMLASYLPASTAHLFSALMEIRKRSIAGEGVDLPLITLLLKNINLKGSLVEFIEGRVLVVKIDVSNDLAFLEIAEVSGVVIHSYSKIQHILMPLDAASGPSYLYYTIRKLDVKKNLIAESSRLSEKLNSSIMVSVKGDLPDSSYHLFILQNLVVDVISSIISAAQKNELLTLLRTCDKLILQKSDKLNIAIQEGAIIFSDVLTRCYSTKDLRTYLEDFITKSLMARNSTTV